MFFYYYKMKALTILISTHNFSVTPNTEYAKASVLNFTQRLVHKPFSGGGQPAAPKLFVSARQDLNHFRFVIGLLKAFKAFIDDISFYDGYEMTYVGVPIPHNACFELVEGSEYRDYQEPVRDFILSNVNADYAYSRLVTMPTGTGKTKTALMTAALLGKKLAIVVLAKYVDKWKSDILECFKISPKKILEVQGAKYLKGLLALAAEDKLKDYDVIIMSMQTLAPYFDTYEEYGDTTLDLGYDVLPGDMLSKCGVGTVIIDETHEHIHLVHRVLTYTHVPMLIGLSATFQSDDPFIARIHKVMFPHEIRINSVKMKKYIHLAAVAYNFKEYNKNKIRTSSWGSTSYSHIEFEKCILNNGNYLNNYLRMLSSTVKSGYNDDYKEGDKCLIFASRIEMVNKIVKHLKTMFPNRKISSYVKDDDYSVLTESDIIVSTLGSAGTAVDVKGLTCVLLSVAINSSVSNLQALGRLREILGRIVRFYYFYCEQISKHVEYHENKQDLFRDRVLKQIHYYSDVRI